jgi:hypothetical protein
MNAMKRQKSSVGRRWCVAFILGSAGVGFAEAPLVPATLTRVQNKVSIGEIKAGESSAGRPAVVSDSVKANNFIKTGSDSRAELQFKDTSLVRVGQNSVFTFEAKSHTLSLDKGDMLFYAAPNQGVRTIKTAALSAAITGTLGKVTPDMMAILRGSTTVTVGGKKYKIPAGWAIKVIHGKVMIFKFDPLEAFRGKLFAMGPLPEDTGIQVNHNKTASHFPGQHDASAIYDALVNSVRQPKNIPVMTQPVTQPATQTVTPPAQTVTPPQTQVPAGGNPSIPGGG